MPFPPPPHEQRERWMTAISASITNATIWRYSRDMLVQAKLLMTNLELGIQKLQRTLDEFWLSARVLAARNTYSTKSPSYSTGGKAFSLGSRSESGET